MSGTFLGRPTNDLLVCVGDLMLDVLVRTPRPTEAMAEGIFVRSGGSAANVAHWARHCGYPSAWMGIVGSHLASNLLLNELHQAGVRTFETRLAGTESGVVLSWLDSRGRRTMHSARWAAMGDVANLRLHELDGAAVHVTGYGSEGERGAHRLESIFAAASRAKKLISFDPSHVGVTRNLGSNQLLPRLRQAGVEVIFANRSEASALAGEKSVRKAALQIGDFVPTVIVKDGGRGSYLCVNHKLEHITAVRSQPVDTTGAGDAYAGAWLASYLRTRDALAACMQASEIAAICVGSLGARPTAN